MKCEKCGNEATFHYQSNINNVKTERHLCAQCAGEEGLEDVFRQAMQPMMGGFFGMPFGAQESFGRLMPSFGAMPSPVAFFPLFGILPTQGETSTKTEEKSADNIPKDAGDEVRQKREITALRHQLHAAVKAEEFEKAAELRDKIRGMER